MKWALAVKRNREVTAPPLSITIDDATETGALDTCGIMPTETVLASATSCWTSSNDSSFLLLMQGPWTSKEAERSMKKKVRHVRASLVVKIPPYMSLDGERTEDRGTERPGRGQSVREAICL